MQNIKADGIGDVNESMWEWTSINVERMQTSFQCARHFMPTTFSQTKGERT
jgi:hypothetical protein